MYIEFRLPTGAGGMAAAHAQSAITRQLKQWSEHNGGIKYRTKAVKYCLRVTFDDDTYYTLFALSWRPRDKHSFWLNYRMITDLNNKT